MTKKADAILHTTIKLFLRDGVRKITMDDIAESSNVSKVTIYKYFTDKDTLYREIGERIFSQYMLELERIVSSDTALVGKLYDFLNVICDFTNSGHLALCGELAKYNAAVEAEYERYLQTYRRSLTALIDEGMREGLVKRNLERDMVFHYIDMGVAYYQQNSEYRERMLRDNRFQRGYMLFYMSHIFVDGETLLSAYGGEPGGGILTESICRSGERGH